MQPMEEQRPSYDGRPAPARGRWTAARVSALRTSLGLSQAGFARLLGVRQQTVSEWETGRYQPRGASVRLLEMIAEEPARYDAGPLGEGHS